MKKLKCFIKLFFALIFPGLCSAQWAPWTLADPTATTNASVALPESFGEIMIAKGIGDGRLYYNVASTNGTWTGFKLIPGSLTTKNSVDAVSQFDGLPNEDLFLLATDPQDNIYFNKSSVDAVTLTTTWSTNWTKIEGVTDVAMTITRPDNDALNINSIFVFSKGKIDHRLYMNEYNIRKNIWKGWSLIPGTENLFTAVSLECVHTDNDIDGRRIYIFATDPLGKVEYTTFNYSQKKIQALNTDFITNGGIWVPWQTIEGITTNLPVGASSNYGNGPITIFAVDASSKKIFTSSYQDPTYAPILIPFKFRNRWTPWTEVNGGFQTNCKVTCGDNASRIFITGLDNKIWTTWKM
jgi:hypothetical protein